MLHYEFMRIALSVGILLGISIPLVGSTAVFKRLSSSGDALAHSSLAGVAIGLAAGLNPLLISIIACVVSFLIIEIIRKRFAKYSELGVAVVLSLGVGLAGILMNYTKTGNIESYLFGSILLINNLELYLAIGMTAAVIIFYALFHSQIFAYIYNESEAKVQGVKTGAVNFTQSLLLSLVIAISAKTIGSLVVSSLIAIPVAASLQLKLGYKRTLLCSVVISVLSVILGIVIAYYANFTPGATIALVSVAFLFLLIIYRVLKDHFLSWRRRERKKKNV